MALSVPRGMNLLFLLFYYFNSTFLFICLQIRRKDMKEHIGNSVNSHLELISNYVLQLSTDLDAMSEKHTSVTSQLRAAKKERDEAAKYVNLINKKLRNDVANEIFYNESNTSQRFDTLILDLEKKDKLAKKMKTFFIFVVVTIFVIAIAILTMLTFGQPKTG
jgi:outer membrane murein-binding lipoprotein Lpp